MQQLDLHAESRFVLTDEQINTQLERDTVILNVNTGKYYSLEGVGSSIWEGIRAGLSLEAIQEAVLQKYQVNSKECLSDIEALVQQLFDAGLIRLAN